MAEFLPGGGIKPYWRIEPVRLLHYHEKQGFFMMVDNHVCVWFAFYLHHFLIQIFEIIFVIYIVYFIINELVKMKQQKRKYWKNYWALAEWGLIILVRAMVSNVELEVLS